MGAVRVKICGVTRAEDARRAAELGADMIGLNFAAVSPRRVGLAEARAIVEALPRGVWRVGVFVDARREEIDALRAELELDAIQLHGDEPEELNRGWPCRVIRAFRLRSPADAARALESRADLLLCEGAAGGGYGGAGEAFPWRWARGLPRERLIVAGGLTSGNVAEAVRTLRPFAVDVASGVELRPGVKDEARMAELIENAKTA